MVHLLLPGIAAEQGQDSDTMLPPLLLLLPLLPLAPLPSPAPLGRVHLCEDLWFPPLLAPAGPPGHLAAPGRPLPPPLGAAVAATGARVEVTGCPADHGR